MQRPLKVLHVLEPAAGEEAILACRAAMAIPGVQHLLWIIGNDQDAARAAALGVRSETRIAVPLGMPELGARRYANLVWQRFWSPESEREDLGGGGRTPDLQMCYSPHAAGLTRAAMGNRGMLRVALLARTPANIGEVRKGSIAAKRLSYALGSTQTLALHPSIREAYGKPASSRRGGLYGQDNIRLFEPPVPIVHGGKIAPVQSAERMALRRELGIPDECFSVALLADPPSAGDAHRFAFLLGLVFAAHVRVCGIVPGWTPRGGGHVSEEGVASKARAAHFLRDHNRRWGMSVTEWPLARSLRAADIAVVLTPEPKLPESRYSCGPTSIALALSMGVPVLSGFSPMVRDVVGPSLAGTCVGGVLGDGAGLTGYSEFPVNQCAGKVIPVLSDPREIERLSGLAQARAKELCAPLGSAEKPASAGEAACAHLGAFERDLLALWEEMMHRPRMREGLPTPPALLDPMDAPVPLEV